MLSHADAGVVQRDRGLPGLSTLLDEEAFAETLQRLCPDRRVHSASAVYVRYKPHTSCLVAYSVRVDDTVVGVYARCHAEDRIVKVANARLKMEVEGPLGPGLLAVPEAGIAVFAFPNDYELRSLRKLYEGERTPPRLRRIVPTCPHLHELRPEALSYKPERRFVGHLGAGGDESLVIRVYPTSEFGKYRQRAWSFVNSGDLRVPTVVGDSQRYSILAHRWVPGTVLRDALCGTERPVPEIGQVASALASLHRQRPRLNALYSEGDYCRALAAACGAIAAVDPDLGARAAELQIAVQGVVRSLQWRSQAVHGDFTADQVVVDSEGVTLLDFDRAAYGHPSMDVGAFSGGLIARSLAGGLPMQQATSVSRSLAASYWAAAGWEDPAGVRAFTAGALLMTAPESFRHRCADWPTRIAAVLESVQQILETEVVDV